MKQMKCTEYYHWTGILVYSLKAVSTYTYFAEQPIYGMGPGRPGCIFIWSAGKEKMLRFSALQAVLWLDFWLLQAVTYCIFKEEKTAYILCIWYGLDGDASLSGAAAMLQYVQMPVLFILLTRLLMPFFFYSCAEYYMPFVPFVIVLLVVLELMIFILRRVSVAFARRFVSIPCVSLSHFV